MNAKPASSIPRIASPHTDAGNGGRSEGDGAFFLLPYRMARYHNVNILQS
ncbi:MAG TPA: hypothetical protein VFB63_06135 [Bryobacteraceae bacterium]|nr:hypothetical protein [Bryobacteraceae bacterium]